ncbi:MAG: hypothetical protein ACFFFG_06295 [Candidatus Thorarchaeota archaeon]
MKIHCDARCTTCIEPRGRSRNIDDDSTAHYCATCRSAYFCEVGVAERFLTPGSEDSELFCVECGNELISKPFDEITLEKARFLMDNKLLSRSGKFRPSLLPRIKIKSSLSLLYDLKSISAFHQSLITELTHLSGLTPQIITNFARDFGIGETLLSNLNGDTDSILVTLGSVSPNFIEILHAILVGRDPTIEGGLALRFSVYAANIASILFISPSGALVQSGPADMLAYDPNGMRIWIYCFPGVAEVLDLEKIIRPLLNPDDQSKFNGVSEIYLVSQKGFSWTALQILQKYPGIVVSDFGKQRLIPFTLWKEVVTPDSRRPEIAFEKIRL